VRQSLESRRRSSLQWRQCTSGVLAVICICLISASAQQQSRPVVSDQTQGGVKVLEEAGPWKMDLLRQPGVLLAEGKSAVPTGQFGLKTYRIEEVTLRTAIRAEVDGQPTQITKAWRLSITGGPFRVRNAAPIIWIDDKPVGFGMEAPDLKSISVLVFDRTLLHNGASLALSYGENDPGRTSLPEKINISATAGQRSQ
jgi:hypothetical protein